VRQHNDEPARTAGKRDLEQLTFSLSNILQRTVVDKTGMSGKFDEDVEWSADLSTPGLMAPGVVLPAEPDDSKPAIFTALQERLGLKLDATRGRWRCS
jgi:uncharacterized protein (TIGR03435 family)